jgi:hypothetical protein
LLVDTRNYLPLPQWTEAGFGVVRLGDGRRHAPILALDAQPI